jgi:hypothetical protein
MEDTIKLMGNIDADNTQQIIASGEVIQAENPYLVIEVDDTTEVKQRKLLNGEYVEELEEPHTLSVITKCPSKWILQDLETGQVYRGTDNSDINVYFFLSPLPPTILYTKKIKN